MLASPNLLFIKKLLTIEIPDAPSNNSWSKMKEECFPDNSSYARSFSCKIEDGAASAGIYEDLNFLHAIINESLEFYLHGDKNSNHRFSWDSY